MLQVTDGERMARTIEYDRSKYNFPVVLMAPPIVLQHRFQKTATCSTVAGTDVTQTLWNKTVNSRTCQRPYQCPQNLLEDSRELLACSLHSQPESFFGASQVGPGLSTSGWFFEFLQTVTEANVMKRIHTRRRGLAVTKDGRGWRRSTAAATAGGGASGGGGAGMVTSSSAGSTAEPTKAGFEQSQGDAQVIYPRSFVDFETRELQILLISFCPDYGIASLVRISAAVSSQVQLDYTVNHYQSIEGERLRQYQVLVGCAILISVLIFIQECVHLYENHSWRKNLHVSSHQWTVGVVQWSPWKFVADMSLQVVLPIVYFALRLSQLSRSASLVDHTTGHSGFSGIPWHSSSVHIDDKMDKFLAMVTIFEDEISLENRMSILFFVMAGVQLFRLIVQVTALIRRT